MRHIIRTVEKPSPIEETPFGHSLKNVKLCRNIVEEEYERDGLSFHWKAESLRLTLPKDTVLDEAEIERLWQEDYDKTAAEVRAKRNRLLDETDAQMVVDRPNDKEAWTAYRQALRDIPEQSGFPYDVVFPIQPK